MADKQCTRFAIAPNNPRGAAREVSSLRTFVCGHCGRDVEWAQGAYDEIEMAIGPICDDCAAPINKLADELVTSSNGVRLRGKFVSKTKLAAVLGKRGYDLHHAGRGIWVALPQQQGATP